MAVDFTALQTEVAAQTTVIGSVTALLKQLHDQLAAIPPSTDPATQAAIDSIKASIAANDKTLADAVVANTPAAAPSAPAPTAP